jgi:pantoate--beta-alanine ligase
MATSFVAARAELRALCDVARTRGERVALVPTMGALHAGHLALVAEAKRRADLVVVSIFVNPTQFGPKEDFARYPRDLDGDARKLAAFAPLVVFAPDQGEMYAEDDQTRVRVERLAEPLEGAYRPGHFEGVATVVAKLFGIVGPCTAIFGRKDYQQLLVVRRMVRDLWLPVEIVGHPIVRERDGLAMSSRNAYLSPEERASAVSIASGLGVAARRFAEGERRARELERLARAPIEAAADSIDYLEVRDADRLTPIADGVGDRAVLVVACRFGPTRLIDNIVFGEDTPPTTEA